MSAIATIVYGWTVAELELDKGFCVIFAGVSRSRPELRAILEKNTALPDFQHGEIPANHGTRERLQLLQMHFHFDIFHT